MNMRMFTAGACVVAVLFSFGVDGTPAYAATSVFTRTLTFGSYGTDVLHLQELLNKDPSTRIAASGPGSPGHETKYFGLLTKDAVIRYQEAHMAIILAPLNLSKGTGIVGPATRAMLLAQQSHTTGTSSQNSILVDSAPLTHSVQPTHPAPTTWSWPYDTPAPGTTNTSNPNLTHLNEFISAVTTLGKKQGMSSAKLTQIADAMRAEAATTTDLKKAFLKHVPLSSTGRLSLEGSLLSTVTHILTSLGIISVADAAGTGVPFGGALLSAEYCTCSAGVWLIFLTDLGPSHADVLTYTEGSQAFASYNIPATPWLLGSYEPGTLACWFVTGLDCTPSAQEGTISSEVGSAP